MSPPRSNTATRCAVLSSNVLLSNRLPMDSSLPLPFTRKSCTELLRSAETRAYVRLSISKASTPVAPCIAAVD